MVSKYVPPPPIKPTRLPERAWQEIAVDLLGPLPTGEHLLVVVEYLSRWMEVDVLRSTTSAAVIKCLDSHFATHGVPAGSNMVTEEMEKCLKEMGIVHHCNTLLWPRANVEVECQEPLTSQCYESLPSRRKRLAAGAQQVSTSLPINYSHHIRCYPTKLFFKMKLTTKLPEFTQGGESQEDVALQQVRDRDSKKQQAKNYADTRYPARDRPIVVGDVVLLERKRQNKLSPPCKSQRYEVTARYGDQVVPKSSQGVEHKWNLQHIKRVVTEPVPDAECSTHSGGDTP